jgi:GNAT superfamily N-acetyltransferase
MRRVVRLTELADRKVAEVQAEAVFWASAGARRFESEGAHRAYRSLWFGRYLQHAPDEFFVALGAQDEVLGYLAGALASNAAPLAGPDYYPLFPPELVARFPAHIHVNVAADRRSAGLGAALVRAFAEHCRKRRTPGLHAVTASGTRSAAFFEKCGLGQRGAARWRGRDLAFLGMQLTA